jgi:GNAT superfamily N-acetyltransferase
MLSALYSWIVILACLRLITTTTCWAERCRISPKRNQICLLAVLTMWPRQSRGELVGCGGWTAAKPGSGEIAEREAHIRHFAIHPHWIRRGIATRLLVRCFSDAQSFGIRKLHCLSTLNAERFYQASGFKRIGPIDVPICSDLTFPCILMSREMA